MPKPKKVEHVEHEVLKLNDEELSENDKSRIDFETIAKMPEDVLSYLFDSAIEKTFGKQPDHGKKK